MDNLLVPSALLLSNIFVSDFDREIIGLLLTVIVLVLLMLLPQLLPELPHALVLLFTLSRDALRCSEAGDTPLFDAAQPFNSVAMESAHANADLVIESQLRLSFLMEQPLFGADACDAVTHILRVRSIVSVALSTRLNEQGHGFALLFTILIKLWWADVKCCCWDGDLQLRVVGFTDTDIFEL